MRRFSPLLGSLVPIASVSLFVAVMRNNHRIYGAGWTGAAVSFWVVFLVFVLLFSFHAIDIYFGPSIGRRERRRKRGYCAECGYDLTGNISGACPECGTATPPS